jgi:hypothetical protein
VVGFFLCSLISAVAKQIQIQTAIQGQMLFWVMDKRDITDEKVNSWINTNYRQQGIYVYETMDKETSQKFKYIMLATGKQSTEGIEIKMESVEGFKDKILINGRVEPPSTISEKSESYPHLVLRIDTYDPRNVVLGTMNLYDVYRDVVNQSDNITLNTAIVVEIGSDNITLATFKKDATINKYNLSKEAMNEINIAQIKQGELVAVNIRNDTDNGYQTIEHIRKTIKTYEKLKILNVDKQENIITIEASRIPIEMKYPIEIQEEVDRLVNDNTYLLKIEKVDGKVTITDVKGM